MKITKRKLQILIKEALDDLEKQTQAELRKAGIDIPDDELESYLDQTSSDAFLDFQMKYKKAMEAYKRANADTLDEKLYPIFKDALRSVPNAMISSGEYNRLFAILANSIRANSYYSSYRPGALLRQTAVDFGLDLLGVEDPADLIEKEVESHMKEFKKPTYLGKKSKAYQEEKLTALGKKHEMEKINFLDNPGAFINPFELDDTLSHNERIKLMKQKEEAKEKEEEKIALRNLDLEMQDREKQRERKLQRIKRKSRTQFI